MKLLRTSLLLLASSQLLHLGKVAADGKINSLKDLALDKKGFDNIRNIHRNWYLFSVKALLAQMAKEFLAVASSKNAAKLKNCLKRIRESKDLTRTARCLIRAKELEEKSSSSSSPNDRPGTNSRNSILERRPWLRKAVRLNLQHFKNRLISRKAQRVRWKRSPHRLITSRILKSDTDILEVNHLRKAPELLEATTSSPAQRLSKLFISLFSKIPVKEIPSRWSVTYRKMLELQKKLEDNEKLPGARVYDATIYDLVTDDGTAKRRGHNESFIPSFLKDAVGIVNSFTGADNARILSPRLAPLLPDKAKSRGWLSPALFPLYKDDSEQQILPVPKILEASGMNEKDRERVLEMIMEVSGARETVDNAMKVLDHLSSFGLGEEMLTASEKIGESFERLRASFNTVQRKELDRRGFTFMEVEQMRRLHNDQGLKEPKIDEQVENYSRLSKSERLNLLWETVADIAAFRKRRTKRQQFQPITVLKPTLLSPYQFAPVFGFSVLGPVVLSPNIFSPLILNPSVLGPWVLSPSFPLPFILSPYLMSPYVLSPLVMAPFILNPYVLSPNVINPYVLSPLVLSPLVLCPDVISPMTLGGAVLSPSVLSPSVLSKSYLMVAVLSPSVLS